MRIAVHGAGANVDKNAPRPAPMEQDTDMFKQKIQLLNESAKRARTESNVDHSALPECVDGLLGEANALFLKNTNTSDVSGTGSHANIDQFGPATNSFLESPAANEIAGFLFSEMHVKEQGLVKLRSRFAQQGFHSSVSAAGSCGGTATLFRSHLAISHPFCSIQPGAAGFDWSSMTLLLKGTPVMFVSVYLTCNAGIAGVNLQKVSEIGSYVTNARNPFVIAGDWNVLPAELSESGWPPNQRRNLAPVRRGNLVHLWQTT